MTPTTRLRAITGAERKASKVSSGSSPKYFEPRILVGLARNRQQTPLARHPAGETFVQLQAHLADRGRMRRVGSAQHQLVVIQQIDQAGIAFREFHHQGNDALQNLLQAHLAHHEPADLLEQPQLLFGALQAHLELFGFRHHLHYRRVPAGRYCASSAMERNSTSVRTGLASTQSTASFSTLSGRSSVQPEVTISFRGRRPRGRL